MKIFFYKWNISLPVRPNEYYQRNLIKLQIARTNENWKNYSLVCSSKSKISIAKTKNKNEKINLQPKKGTDAIKFTLRNENQFDNRRHSPVILFHSQIRVIILIFESLRWISWSRFSMNASTEKKLKSFYRRAVDTREIHFARAMRGRNYWRLKLHQSLVSLTSNRNFSVLRVSLTRQKERRRMCLLFGMFLEGASAVIVIASANRLLRNPPIRHRLFQLTIWCMRCWRHYFLDHFLLPSCFPNAFHPFINRILFVRKRKSRWN